MENVLITGTHLVQPSMNYADKKISVDSLKKKLCIAVSRLDETEMEFDWLEIYPGFANAIRRILLSEVPTMAIEKVHINNNTSLIQDEVLAHRLGLIPLKADARLFDFHDPSSPKYSDKDSLEFELKVICTQNPHSRFGHHRPEDKYINHNVYSKDIKWTPIEGQASLFKEENIGPVVGDILIAKLRPGQEIDTKLIAVKSIGKDHAKFSPVATASYRLLPYIELKQKVTDDLATLLQKCFSPGVIGIKNIEGTKTAYVKQARLDTCSRNHEKVDELKDKVVTGRVSNHYIFTVESTVGLPPDELVREAIKVLKRKCTSSLANIKELLS